MATVEIVTLADSLDERIKSNVETVVFFNPLTGEKMEIELGEANRKHFANHLDKLTKYVDAGRKVEATKPASKGTNRKNDLTPVREWAKANGYDVGERGRIKAEILEAYDKAQMPTAIKDDKVALTVTPEAQAKIDDIADKLESAIENSADGNVKDMGDFTQYADDKIDETETNEVDSTNDSDTDEFAQFLRDNMDENGKVHAGSLKNAPETVKS